jgi:ElaA protein
MKLHWIALPFSQLSLKQLYDLLKLRMEVFVVEQNCPYQDNDGKDEKSYHLLGINPEGLVLAYARILPAGLAFREVSIGRVCTSASVRKNGSGKELMRQALLFIKNTYGGVPVRIGAQLYLKRFYSGLGFSAEGEEYLEDNIPHVEMVFTSQ